MDDYGLFTSIWICAMLVGLGLSIWAWRTDRTSNWGI